MQRERQERLSAELRTIAMVIVTREGPLKLQRNDLKQLYDTARSCLY
jgi:hypothetical protein